MIRIGPLQVYIDRPEVFLDGELVRLGSRAFDMLAVSVRGYRLVQSAAVADAVGESGDGDELEDVTQGRSVLNNLPAHFSALIGRDKAIDDISLALDSARHVTLVGSGGIGRPASRWKSRVLCCRAFRMASISCRLPPPPT